MVEPSFEDFFGHLDQKQTKKYQFGSKAQSSTATIKVGSLACGKIEFNKGPNVAVSNLS